MSLQLQQNLYSIYRLFLKLPRYLFIIGLVSLLFIAFTQWNYLANNRKEIDISQCMLDYVLQKHRNTIINESAIHPNSTNIENNTVVKQEQYVFLNEKTLISIEFAKVQQCKYLINYPYKFDNKNIPLMTMVQNEQLAYISDQSEQYLKDHSITFDKFIVPDMQLEQPLVSYFFPKEMQKNQLVIESIRSSFFKLEEKLNTHMKNSNITNYKLSFTQLYLIFYSSDGMYRHKLNLLQFVTFKIIPSFIIKIVVFISTIGLLYFLSIFVGLFIRYTLIFIYTAFLIVYDKCMRDGWGWVHLNLVILYARFRQNSLTTFKIMFFYIVANLGIYGLLAFGSYCIIKLLLFPIIPLPIDSYSDFFFKTIFAIQLFLYVFCRSRTSLKFFPILSFILSYSIIVIGSLKVYGNIINFLNLNFTLQLILFTIFLMIEQALQDQSEKGLVGQFCPSLNKPRMLFYAGYDMSWEKTLPPIWTYFTRWFDYTHFNQNQKCLIEKDYQLLYGRMLGLNERQEIPEYQEQDVQRNALHDLPSNEMNLIPNDM